MDIAKLKYYLYARKKTIGMYEAALGISRTALYRKMHQQTEFTREEIQKTITFLGLKDDEIIEIFFTKKVS